MKKTILIGLIMIAMLALVQPVLFYENPWLGDYSGTSLETIRTSENIYCKWNASEDATNARVIWYKNNGIVFQTLNNFDPTPDIWPIIDKTELVEEDTWNCTITIENATANVTMSDKIYIDYDPMVYVSNGHPFTKINRTYQLLEDQTYNTIWNTTATDAISDMFQVSPMCTGGGATYGTGTCAPRNSDLGSDKNASNTKLVTFSYKHARGTQEHTINFTILPVNDAPLFNVTNTTINQTDRWQGPNATITATDEEGNPITFTVTFDNLRAYEFCTYAQNTTAITFNCTPTPIDIGNFTINITATDSPPSNGFNLTPADTTKTMVLEVLRVNHIPNITYVSDFNSSQNQNFTIIINATDIYDNNTLNFTIQPNNCSLQNPWTGVESTTIVSGELFNITSYGTGIWNGTLTNSHIACRNVTITVTDSYGESNSTTAYLNISNVNDPPIIENYSANLGDILNNRYIYNLTAYVNASFIYRINVTDPDLLVTNPLGIDSFNESLTYATNDTWLSTHLGVSTGIINSTRVNRTTGNFSITINVTDNGDIERYTDSIDINLEVRPNNAPRFTQALNFTSQCYEYDSVNYPQICRINLSQYAEDTDPGDRVANFTESSNLVNITNEGMITLNASQAMVGIHIFNVTITDTRGTSHTEGMTFYIRNTNNKPNISNIRKPTPPNALYYNKTLNNKITIEVSDLDEQLDVLNDTTSLRYKYENLTFTWVNNQAGNLSGYVSIDQTDRKLVINTTKTINNQLLNIGDYSINITVRDNYFNYTNGTSLSENNTYMFNFTVYNTTTTPVITAIYPYGDSNQQTVFAWKEIGTSEYITYINTTENSSIFFNQTATDDQLSIMKLKWFYDGTEISNTTINYNSSTTFTNNNASMYFNFGFFEATPFSNKTHNLTLRAIDGYDQSEYDEFTWMIKIYDLNRPVTLKKAISNITIDGPRAVRDKDFFECEKEMGFYDPDYDLDSDGLIECNETDFTIRYTFYNNTGSTNNTVSICDGFANLDVTNPYYNVTIEGNLSKIYGHGMIASPVKNGTCNITLNATDGEYSLLSNLIVMSVSVPADTSISNTEVSQRSGTRTITETETVQVPVPEEVEKPVYIDIVMPDMVTVYENNTIEIPLKVTNTWNNTVYGVTLSYEINSTANFNVKIGRDQFYKIDPGEVINTTLTISGYRVGGIYEITVYGNVTDPPYTDSAKIYLNSIEQTSTGAKLRTLVRFAQDLLKKNKECQELGELLEEAQKEVITGDQNKAFEMLDSIINGCKYLISKQQKEEQPKSIRDIHLELRPEYLTYGALIAATIFFMSGTFMLLRKKKD